MEFPRLIAEKVSKNKDYYDLRTKRLLDQEQEYFTYTLEDLSEQLSYGIFMCCQLSDNLQIISKLENIHIKRCLSQLKDYHELLHKVIIQ